MSKWPILRNERATLTSFYLCVFVISATLRLPFHLQKARWIKNNLYILEPPHLLEVFGLFPITRVEETIPGCLVSISQDPGDFAEVANQNLGANP